LPASTQWDIVSAVARQLAPAFDELIRQAARGDVLHNDDTTVKILALMGEPGGPGSAIAAGEGTVPGVIGMYWQLSFCTHPSVRNVLTVVPLSFDITWLGQQLGQVHVEGGPAAATQTTKRRKKQPR
jgi:hypothetical protein